MRNKQAVMDQRLFGVLEDGVEGVGVEGAEAGESGGGAEAAELVLGALPPLGPVGGHDEDVVLEQRPRPGAAVRHLRHHRLAGDHLAAAGRRQRAVAVAEDGRALLVGPRRQDPLHEDGVAGGDGPEHVPAHVPHACSVRMADYHAACRVSTRLIDNNRNVGGDALCLVELT